MKKYTYLILIILAVGLTGVVAFYFLSAKQNSLKNNTSNTPQAQQNLNPVPEIKKEVYSPIDNAKSKVTKKLFGVYITPKTSPVQLERFTGYHTGTDFEITSDELTKNVEIKAICDGTILKKQKVSGYGGVIIESCIISGSPVTVLYGHVDITASSFNIGDPVKGGEMLVYLAPDKSEYTDGERKHLHLGIHKGEEINFAGYVKTQPELTDWIDIGSFLD